MRKYFQNIFFQKNKKQILILSELKGAKIKRKKMMFMRVLDQNNSGSCHSFLGGRKIKFLPVNEQMDKHQGLRLMRYGSESEGYQPVKPLFFFCHFT